MTATIPSDRLQDYIAHTSTLGRMGEQHELDAAVIFLAAPPRPTSPASRWPSTAACPDTDR